MKNADTVCIVSVLIMMLNLIQYETSYLFYEITLIANFITGCFFGKINGNTEESCLGFFSPNF